MELNDLLKIGAELIESNDDQATAGLDISLIIKALQGLIQNADGGIDLATIVGSLSQNGLGEIVGSWLGAGENKAISPEEVTVLLGDDKVDAFAKELGIDDDSAKKALSDALPTVVDKATSEHSIIDEMLGGNGNAMATLSSMFR